MAGKKSRLNLYIAEEIRAGLETLATKTRRSPSAQVEVLVEQALEAAYADGTLPKPETEEAQKLDYETAVSILKVTSDKNQIRLSAITETAQLLGLNAEKLLETCIDVGLQPKNGNGTSKQKEVNA